MGTFTAFAVIEIQPKRYQPSRIEVEDGKVVAILPLQEAMTYRPLAYEYLQGEVRRHYAGLWKEEAATKAVTVVEKRGPGRPKRK